MISSLALLCSKYRAEVVYFTYFVSAGNRRYEAPKPAKRNPGVNISGLTNSSFTAGNIVGGDLRIDGNIPLRRPDDGEVNISGLNNSNIRIGNMIGSKPASAEFTADSTAEVVIPRGRLAPVTIKLTNPPHEGQVSIDQGIRYESDGGNYSIEV